MTYAADKLKIYRQIIMLRAELAGLNWCKDGATIKRHAAQIESLSRQLGMTGPLERPPFEVLGLYHHDELGWAWTPGEVDHFEFSRWALHFLVSELADYTGFDVYTLEGLAADFGPAVVAMLFDEVESAMSGCRTEYRRWRTRQEDDEHEIFAKPDEFDDRFGEAPLEQCDPEAQGAGPVTIISIDIAEIIELIEARDNAARRALRGEKPE